MDGFPREMLCECCRRPFTLLHDGAGEAATLLQEGEARLGVGVLLSPGWSSSGWTSCNRTVPERKTQAKGSEKEKSFIHLRWKMGCFDNEK